MGKRNISEVDLRKVERDMLDNELEGRVMGVESVWRNWNNFFF